MDSTRASTATGIPTKQIYKEIWLIAFPAIIAAFASSLYELMNLIFIGQLNEPEMLAGVGLAYVYMNIFTVMLLGINTGVVTLVS